MLNIYDANNYLRLLLERDITGLTPRTILNMVNDSNDPAVFVWDGPGGLRRRREIYDGYKRNRPPLKSDITTSFQIIEEVLKHTKAIQVRVPGYEADDVIAALAREYAKNGEQVAIYSNDQDFGQLVGEYPTRIFAGYKPKEDVPAHLTRYYKLTVGDPSDNIPGIKGFGKKTWAETNKAALTKWIDDIIERGEIRDIGLPPRIKVDPDQLRLFSQIIAFLPISLDEISKHMTVGTPNYAAADEYLKRFFQ